MADSLAAALAELQTNLPEIRKSETAHVKSDKGNYSYSYADLAAISRALLPRMGPLGLSFTSRPTMVGDRFVLAYALVHTSGDREAGEYPLPSGGSPQAIGSAITYARRYALCAVTGVAPDSDDDDGAKAEGEHRRDEWETATTAAATPAQAAKYDELAKVLAGAESEQGLRSAWEQILTAFKADEITTVQANALRAELGKRKAEVEARDRTDDTERGGAAAGGDGPRPRADGEPAGDGGPGRDGEASGVRPGLQSGVHRGRGGDGAAQASRGGRGAPATAGR